MAKQDEIREGMEFICESGFGLDWNSSVYLVDTILEYQKDNSVVINVENELPPTPQILKDSYGFPLGTRLYKEVAEHLIKAGYVATESLIESDCKGIDGKPYIVGSSGMGSAVEPLIKVKDGRTL
ncbi:hypothetical protein LCGC14_0890590 [marine sediment metagenome]|uniref:Uncharacterized protein n=1 Tax=marine sediment metagenome TaxID=412755 RepID=A0A0F9PK46_9ZZZZ